MKVILTPTSDILRFFLSSGLFNISLISCPAEYRGQQWVTKEENHVRYAPRRWTWLISSWSHANVAMRFMLFYLPNKYGFIFVKFFCFLTCASYFIVEHSDLMLVQMNMHYPPSYLSCENQKLESKLCSVFGISLKTYYELL